jgi:hypothetical protein|uniref:Uncharacterized protein n=1 Tax=Ackermannviridae sp. TaxID=2831612 RepID=A0A8S5VU36_9CAUD|nr:MAG TPA: hypothetical protein [Ackermannviridae sp.]
MKIAENRSERKESTKESQGEYFLIIMVSSVHMGISILNIFEVYESSSENNGYFQGLSKDYDNNEGQWKIINDYRDNDRK